MLAVVGGFAHFACFIWLWWRVEYLRAETNAAHLPSALYFFTGAIVFWLWSDGHRRSRDPQLSAAVFVARSLQVAIVVLVGSSYFFHS